MSRRVSRYRPLTRFRQGSPSRPVSQQHRSSAAPQLLHGRAAAARRARRSGRGTATSRDSQGAARGSSRGARTGAGPRVPTFSFLKHETKVTQHPGLSLHGGGQDQPEPPREPGSRRQRPRVPRTRAAPGVQQPSEPQPSFLTAFNPELEETARRHSPQCRWNSWC